MPVPGHVGSDYERLRPDFTVIADPYSGRSVLLVPAITPDVALLHAIKADPEGNLLLDEKEDDVLLARASRVVVASTEEIVDAGVPGGAPYGLRLSGIYVTALVHLPGGAHPTACHGRYGLDDAHLGEYVRLAASEATFREYLQRWVFDLKDHARYLAEVGL
jgi:glutaconate CoA-transferase subunit A